MHSRKTIICLILFAAFIFGYSLSCTMNVVQSDLFSPQSESSNEDSIYPYSIHHGIIELDDASSSEYLYLSRSDAQAEIMIFGGRDWIPETGIPFYKALAKTIPLNIFFVSYRGYGKGKGTPSALTIKHDAAEAFNYHTNFIHNERNLPLYIVGYSLGGFAAATLSEKKPLSGIILVSTFSNSQELADLYLHQKIPQIVSVFFNFKIEASLLEMNTISELERYKGPLLLIHGKDDFFIPESMSNNILHASPSIEKKLISIEDCGHNEILDDCKPLNIVTLAIKNFILGIK